MIYKKSLKEIKFLVGDKKFNNNSLNPYNNNVCHFLDKFSLELRKKKYNRYPDLKSLSFWCRKKNIDKLKINFDGKEIKKGRGLIFHITPSNVPTNFMYSLIFGLLTGNSNVVKVPSKKITQILIICKIIRKLLNTTKFKKIKDLIKILSFKKDDESFTEYLSKICDVRIIWGGDKTINTIRKFQIQERSIEITFPDRQSLCIINSDKIVLINKFDLKKIIKNFYNDTYLYDQNACSSPNLILWTGRSVKLARKKFWNELYNLLKNQYDIPEKAAFDKFNKLAVDIVNLDFVKFYEKYENLIYTVFLKRMDQNFENLKSKWGYFYECKLENVKLKEVITKKYQTLTYFGFKKNFLKSFFNSGIRGIDRVVPIGQATDMSFNWDGYDINNILTRTIEMR